MDEFQEEFQRLKDLYLKKGLFIIDLFLLLLIVLILINWQESWRIISWAKGLFSFLF